MTKEIIIDKSFLDRFVEIYDPENELHADFKSFLKKVRDFDLIINYTNRDEFEEALKNNPILDIIIDTKPPEITYNKNLLTDLISNEFYNNSSPIKIFLVELSSEECSKLSEKFGFEYLSTTNISNRWKIYSGKREDFKMKVTKDQDFNCEIRFDSWNKLDNFNHPVHSIIIDDHYILTNNSNQQLKDNLYPLIKKLTNTCCKNRVFHLTIITEKLYAPIDKVYEDLRFIFDKDLGMNYHLNIILHNKSMYPSNFEDLKWRRIYTNYFIIKSDKSFNFFKHNSRINQKSDIEFEFIFNNYEWQSFKKDIFDIRRYVDKVENRPAIGSCKEIMNFCKDKENRLIYN